MSIKLEQPDGQSYGLLLLMDILRQISEVVPAVYGCLALSRGASSVPVTVLGRNVLRSPTAANTPLGLFRYTPRSWIRSLRYESMISEDQIMGEVLSQACLRPRPPRPVSARPVSRPVLFGCSVPPVPSHPILSLATALSTYPSTRRSRLKCP